ncbi:MAG TPA: rod shape-determining protein RodA [Parasegetibacter sp.]
MNQNNAGISKGVDWLVIWIYVVLVVVGILCIFANEYRDNEDIINGFLSLKSDYSKQTLFFGLSLVAGTFILLTDSKFFTATANLFYAFGIFLLLLVFPFHTEVKGTESIIRFGTFQLQPAELCKVFANLALAKYLSQITTDFTKLKSQLIAAGIVLLPAILSIMQKETGLALVYFSFFIVMYREGLPVSVLVIGFSLAVLVVATLLIEPNKLAIALTAIALLTVYIMRRQIKRKKSILFSIIAVWLIAVGIQRFGVPFLFTKVFQKHQVERIFNLVGRENPYAANTPEEVAATLNAKKKPEENYNVRQSKIAIGSGGWLGKGYLKGTQTRYDFVPEQRTDFIFCTIGEGFGFVGSFIFLSLYTILLLRIVRIAERQRSTFSRVYAYGVASVLFAHIAINICMTIGLAPVIGIPLPFVSYGGTSLLSFSILLFIMVRLDADRQMVLR